MAVVVSQLLQFNSNNRYSPNSKLLVLEVVDFKDQDNRVTYVLVCRRVLELLKEELPPDPWVKSNSL